MSRQKFSLLLMALFCLPIFADEPAAHLSAAAQSHDLTVRGASNPGIGPSPSLLRQWTKPVTSSTPMTAASPATTQQGGLSLFAKPDLSAKPPELPTNAPISGPPTPSQSPSAIQQAQATAQTPAYANPITAPQFLLGDNPYGQSSPYAQTPSSQPPIQPPTQPLSQPAPQASSTYGYGQYGAPSNLPAPSAATVPFVTPSQPYPAFFRSAP